MELLVDTTIKLELVKDDHAEGIYQVAAGSREHLREWLPWVDQMKSVEFIKKFINGSKERYEEGQEYAFVIMENDKVMGRIGIYKMDAHNKIGEIGYWIGKEAQGRGIVLKSCKALINFCFNSLHLNRIEIKCGTGNSRSQAIPEKLRFTKEGVIRRGELVHGKLIDLNSYSLLREELPTD